MLNISQLKAIIWMHVHGLALVPYPRIVPERLECHPKVSNALRRETDYMDFSYDSNNEPTVCSLRLVEVYPDFRESEWRIMSSADVELYHSVDPDGILIRPAVLDNLPNHIWRRA